MNFFKLFIQNVLKTWTPGPDNVIKQSIINNNRIKSNGIKIRLSLTYNWTWGQYRVAESHKQYQVTATAWLNKTPQERERLFKRFKGYIPKDKRVISSTDGMMNVIKPRTFGKKIGQRKRKINEQTTTFRKKKD